MSRIVLFEEENAIEVEVEVDYTYSYTPGRTCGPPELCYPADETCEVSLVDGWEAKVKAKYMEMAEDMIRHIREFEFDRDQVAEWAGEDAEADEDAKAEAEMDRRREFNETL